MLGKILNLSEPQFPHLKHGEGGLGGFNEVMLVGGLAWCLALSHHSIQVDYRCRSVKHAAPVDAEAERVALRWRRHDPLPTPQAPLQGGL